MSRTSFTASLPFRSELLRGIDRAANWSAPLLPLSARLGVAGVLAGYFWNSALTKLGDGPTGFLFPSNGAYIQIFPRAMESAGYDAGQLSLFHTVVVLAGTWAEFLLPLLIVIGLATPLAALGMIGFILVQSLTDIVGHGLARADIGRWFDADPASLIADQRALWIVVLLILVVRGAGPLSIDSLILSRLRATISTG